MSKLNTFDSSDSYSKKFKYTIKLKNGKILLQSIISFGSKEDPFPDNWKNDYLAQCSVFDYKQKFINENLVVDISEDIDLDI